MIASLAALPRFVRVVILVVSQLGRSICPICVAIFIVIVDVVVIFRYSVGSGADTFHGS